MNKLKHNSDLQKIRKSKRDKADAEQRYLDKKIRKLNKEIAKKAIVEGSFYDVSKDIVKDEFLNNWFEFLSFALSGPWGLSSDEEVLELLLLLLLSLG